MRRSQATRKPTTLTDVVFASIRSIHETIGTTAFSCLSILLVLSVFGGLHHVFGANEDRAEMISSIPDGISAECHMKLLRAYSAPPSVDENTNAQNSSGHADNCGDIGVVK